jgi:hypothetical protein
VTAPALAPYLPTYASRVPYIALGEYMAAPTAVDSSNLVQGGNTTQNLSELTNVIGRASSWADLICHQVLAATVDMQVGEYRVRNGQIKVPVDYTPLIAVTAVSVGWQAGQFTALTDLSGLWFQRKVVTIPVFNVNFPSPIWSSVATSASGKILAEVTYVNGYPNTMLMATVAAGATSIVVDSAVGIYPGTTMMIYDDFPGVEQITVAPSYIAGATTLPLVAPLIGGHSKNVSVSSLPPAIKQAVISLTSCLIKTRGNLALVMAGINAGAGTIEDKTDGAVDDLGIAMDLLEPFARVR